MELKPTITMATICALSALSREDMYGEQICREIERVVGSSPETDMLENLITQGFAETYEWPYDGETRRFFRLTSLGQCLLEQSLAEWDGYKRRIDLFLGLQGDNVSPINTP